VTSRTRANVHDFRVLSNELVAEGVARMVCHTTVAGVIQAGQFVNIQVPGDGSHILRIPLSFSHADSSNLTLEFVYAIVGEGTQRLSRMCVGEVSTLVGPSGRGWWLPAYGARSLLVAGGVGLAPVVACARMLAKANLSFDVVVGAQTAARHVESELDLLRTLAPQTGCDCARKVVVTTDDGTLGMHGYTTDAMKTLLAERNYTQVYACGPQPMMAGVARMAAEKGIDCQCSLERMMGCGFGACSCCNVELREGGYALCCQDGPVFDAKEVAW